MKCDFFQVFLRAKINFKKIIIERWKHNCLKVADVNKDGKLATQWAKEGYVVKRRHKGYLRWTNWWFKEKLVYFDTEDVKLDSEAAVVFLKKGIRKKRLATKKKKNMIFAGWRKGFREIKRILFFQGRDIGTRPY